MVTHVTLHDTACLSHHPPTLFLPFFLFSAPATPEIYTLSLHDALPISTAAPGARSALRSSPAPRGARAARGAGEEDRKSTRLNSSHGYISYAVFCLKKKKEKQRTGDNIAANYSRALPRTRVAADSGGDL